MEYDGEFLGNRLVDRHTHYEAHMTVDSQSATLIIRGDIAKEFRRKYRIPLFNAGRIRVKAHLIKNCERTIPDQFKSPNHLIGHINSLEDLEIMTS